MYWVIIWTLRVYGFGIDHVNDVLWGADYQGGQIVKATIGAGNTWTCDSAVGSPTSKSRMQVATDVIKVLMQDSSLTDGANFGLLNWSWSDWQLKVLFIEWLSILSSRTLPLKTKQIL